MRLASVLKPLLATAGLLLAGTAHAALVTVWDTHDGTPSGLGVFVGSSEPNARAALAFIPSTSGYLADVTLGAGQGNGGTTDWTMQLYSDAAGLPGSALETLTSLDVGPPGGPSATYTSFASQTTLLTAGNTYWLVASLPTDSVGYWSSIEGGATGLRAFSYDGDAWQAETDTFAPAADIRVETTPVPLPAAAWLFLSGAGAVVSIARRKSRREKGAARIA